VSVDIRILGFEQLFEVVGVESVPFVGVFDSVLGSTVEHLHHVLNAKVLAFREVEFLEMVEDEATIFLDGIGVFVLVLFGFEGRDKLHLHLWPSGCLLTNFEALSSGEQRLLTVKVYLWMRMIIAECE
jgi:hypothetical protein